MRLHSYLGETHRAEVSRLVGLICVAGMPFAYEFGPLFFC